VFQKTYLFKAALSFAAIAVFTAFAVVGVTVGLQKLGRLVPGQDR
jgi:hypothetical protein